MLALVLASLGALLWSAGRRIVTGHAKGLIAPFTSIVSSVLLIVFATRSALRYVLARGGIDWNQPGQAIKQLASLAESEVSTVNWIWMSPRESLRYSPNIFVGLIPVAMLVLAISVAVIVRRTDFSTTAQSASRTATLVLVSAMALFVISYLGLMASSGAPLWTVFGGPPSSPLLIAEFVSMAVMAVLAVQASLRLLKNRQPISVESS
jgi:hypothetical protein